MGWGSDWDWDSGWGSAMDWVKVKAKDYRSREHR